ncbi:hypothetical protein EVAR_60008_1 [Eumeta japonica]|uniref:Uncharacterized protein n=1 Tax=Eumeta variegata TaxID=151549 RepID=A0A4C1ZLC4_EUMVA|nr:hypothetical protein EVAR_60008_1 [Eumeta japonica]
MDLCPSPRKQSPSIEPESSWEASRRSPPGLALMHPITESAADFAGDIEAVMSVLRTVKSSEISEFARDIRCTKEYGIDILLLQETFLKLNRAKSCALAEYVQLRTDRTDAPLDHRPVLLRMGPPAGGYPEPIIKITDWKKVSTALEKVDTLALNNIPDVIKTTDEIENSIGALTNLIKKVVKRCSREVPTSVDCRKLLADVLELLRAKNVSLRNAYAYPSRENRSRARALQHRVRARMMDVKNEKWSNLMEDTTPSHQSFWKLTKAFKT